MYFIIFFFGVLFSEIDVSFSYELKYGNGKQVTIQDTSDYNYLENLLDINTSFSNNMYLYTQLEYSEPPVFGDRNNKLNQIISNFFLEYENDRLSLTLGDLHDLYGRGLTYYSMIDQNVDYSNLLRGVSINYFLKDNLKLSGLYGQNELDFRSNPSFRKSDQSIFTSANILSLDYENDILGFINYNYLKQKLFIDPSTFNLIGKTDLHDDFNSRLNLDSSGFLASVLLSSISNTEYVKDTIFVNNHNLNWNFYIGNFDVYIDKAWIDYQKIYGDNVFGSRFYSSIYTDIADIGVTYEYKNYNTPYLVKTLANPPIVYREGSSILASRNAHAFNFGNEVGHQIDFNKNVNGVNLVANFSISRRHKEEDVPKYNFVDFISIEEDSTLSLYDPFRQIYFETNGWLFSEKLYFKLASDYFIELLDQKHTSAITFPTQWVLKRNSGNSFTMYFELQNKIVKQFDQSFIVTSEKKYFSQYLSISFNRLGKWIVTGFFDQEIIKDEAEKWLGVDFSYNINEKTQFSLFYGSQKGGLVCANGICAEQPGFEDGFKVTLRSIF